MSLKSQSVALLALVLREDNNARTVRKSRTVQTVWKSCERNGELKMKELTITAKDFAELFADADKMVDLREIDEHGKSGVDSYGFYWSSTLESFDNSSKEYAWLLYMDGGYGKIQTWNIMTVNGPVHGSSREDGRSIRPVCK